MNGMFSKKSRQAMIGPIVKENPITVQVLGICSSLAVTAQLKPSLVMGLSVIAVLTLSNVLISLLRKYIPSQIRMIVELTVIATLVIVVDQLLRAYSYGLAKQLSVFVGLIITNCILMGRAEAFALSHGPWLSLLDGLGNGMGYALALAIVGFFRELLGSGSIFGLDVVPQNFYRFGYLDNGLIVLAPGAFILLGLLIWFVRSLTNYVEKEAK